VTIATGITALFDVDDELVADDVDSLFADEFSDASSDDDDVDVRVETAADSCEIELDEAAAIPNSSKRD
jgi:hypothetical protein